MTPFNNTRSERAASFPNLNYNEMRKICSDKPGSIARKYGFDEYDTRDGKAWFKDNGASVLAVAHVDSCHPFTHFSLAKMKSDTWIFCPTLDDRLGVYIMLDWLEKAKIKVDILLTDNEEKGNSTARNFNFPHRRQYNWMFMFDRSGTDVATYQYGDTITKAALAKHGYTQSYGAYSCIVELDDLNCKGFNFGTGYYNPHSNGPKEFTYASRVQLIESLHKFSRFFGEYRNTHFSHENKTSYLADKFQSELPFKKYDQEGTYLPIYDINTQKLITQESENKKYVTKGSEDKMLENSKAIIEQALAKQKKGRTELLAQNIGLLNLDDKIVEKLYANNTALIVELVQMRSPEILKIKDISFKDMDEIRKALSAVGLELWTTPYQLQKDYGILKTIEKSSKGTTIRYNFTTLNNHEITINNWSYKEELEPTIPEVVESRQIIQLKPLDPQEIINVQYLPVLATENVETIPSDKQVQGKEQTVIMMGLERWHDDEYALDANAGKLQWRKKTKEVGFTLAS